MALGHGEGGAPAEDMSALEVPSVSVVCLASLVMVLVAGLGGIPFFFVERMSNWCHGVANAFAMGVMLACSFDLLRDGQKWSSWQPLTGLLAGATLVKACQRALEGREAVALQALSKGMTTRKSLLLLGTMALHSFGEGAGVGAAFCGSSGVLTSIAMGIHNIPEVRPSHSGISISLGLRLNEVNRGKRKGRGLVLIRGFFFCFLNFEFPHAGLGSCGGPLQ